MTAIPIGSAPRIVARFTLRERELVLLENAADRPSRTASEASTTRAEMVTPWSAP